MLNKKLSLTFQYEKNPSSKNRVTTCIIKDISNGEKFNEAKTLASSTVVKSNKDADNKFNARKYALKSTLNSNHLFTRADRTQIWSQYLASVNVP